MSKVHVLIVENARVQRRTLRSELGSLDDRFEVLDVASGEEALLILANQPMDLLITGFRLAGISGVELTRKARQHKAGLKVILLGGEAGVAAGSLQEHAEVDFWLPRPLDHADFLDAVERCLGLVKGSRPPPAVVASIAPPVVPAAEGALPGRLTALRKELGAVAVFLLDKTGQVLTQVGEFPRSGLDNEALLPAVMAAVNAAGQVTRALGAAEPAGYQYYRAPSYEAASVPVGPALALLALLESTPDGKNCERASRPLLAAVEKLLKLVSVPPAPASQSESELKPKATPQAKPLDPVEPDPALENIFKKSTKKLKPAEVDQFWDTLAQQPDAGDAVNAGAISYEQARRLGLTPGEDNQ